VEGSAQIGLAPVGRDDPAVRALYADFIREADSPLGAAVDLEREIAAGPPANLAPPHGVLLLARIDGDPAGLGGIRHLDAPAAEIKSMYVAPAYRGLGLGRLIVDRLERIAAEHGCRATRLDTSAYLTAAVALYRAAGYVETADYNGNPKADLWFEKRLDEPVRIVPYDPDWPRRFSRERAALEGAIGRWASGGIHHVGSTAVPGLEAKPIIDILVGVESLAGSRACFEPLEQLGYLHAPYLPEEMHWFCKPHPSRRTHHLHLAPTAGRRFAEELAFRDRLRADAGLAAAYGELKRSLAGRLADDREAYTEAKGAFIHEALSGQE
jgi:GrpB-like predicted nucleotidyltransferase (UPF0157 family)/ribosomal protein S18 acetylase RimI-like enzyme